MNGTTDGTRTLCALLVDLENLYLAIKDKHSNPGEVTIAVLQNLQIHLKDELGITPVVGRGYGPMDYSLSRHLINDIALMGITPVHVLARASKNSADLMLAIDAMEILFSRPDITTFVIVGGDRDYIPVVERIRQNARGILVVSPRHAMSGDLLTIIGKESYLEAGDGRHRRTRSSSPYWRRGRRPGRRPRRRAGGRLARVGGCEAWCTS